MYLSKFYRVVVDGEVIDSEVPKKTRELIEELDIEELKNRLRKICEVTDKIDPFHM